jgi:hypothetical protein
MAPKQDNLGTILLIVLVLLLFAGGTGGNAPFKAEKPSALVVEKTESRTTQLASIMFAIQTSIQTAGGEYRQLDDQQTTLDSEAQWVKDAYDVWIKDGKQTPWVVGANKTTGFSQAVPASKEAATALAQKIGGK